MDLLSLLPLLEPVLQNAFDNVAYASLAKYVSAMPTGPGQAALQAALPDLKKAIDDGLQAALGKVVAG